MDRPSTSRPSARGLATFRAHAGVFRDSTRFRLLRFFLVGAVCGAAQLGLLFALNEGAGLGSWSNLIAFVASAQLNFLLNYGLTWGDRMGSGRSSRSSSLVRLLGFNALIAAGAALNQSVYLVAAAFSPYMLAGVIGIGATTLAKYLAADRWIFAVRNRPAPLGEIGFPEEPQP